MPKPYKRRSPAGAPHTEQGSQKKHPAQYTVIREVIAIAVIGALLAVLMVDSIVGMSSQFGPTPEVGVMLAGVAGHE